MLARWTLFIEGYMQPVGRYNYRQVVHVVKQQSFTAALREGTFTSVGNRTFFAGTEKDGSAIGPIFIYEKLMKEGKPEGVRVTTADEGLSCHLLPYRSELIMDGILHQQAYS